MGVPLSKYWQNKHNIPLFHPMHAGNWLFENPKIENLNNVIFSFCTKKTNYVTKKAGLTRLNKF